MGVCQEGHNQSNPNFNSKEYNLIQNFRKERFLEFYNIIKNHNTEFNSSKYKNKLIINFYNKIRKEIYVDLEDRVIDIFKFILCSIGLWKNYDKIYERQKQNQTTEYIVENPFIEFHGRPNDLLSFRCKNKEIDFKWFNLYENSPEYGINFGLKDENEIFLQLNDERLKAHALGKTFYVMGSSGGGDSMKLCFNYEGASTVLQASEAEIIDDLFDRYLVKAGLNPNDTKFYYNRHEVRRCGLTLFELGITNRGTFNVVSSAYLMGAGGLLPGIIDFADVKSGKTKRLDFSGLAPKWRSVVEGLNIFGVCKNSKCEAYKKEVVNAVGIPFKPPKFIKFDLKKEVLNIKCPMCGKIIKAKTCGFWNCEYQFSGITIEDGEQKKFDSNPKEAEFDEFEYFDPNENGETEWVELIIYVLPKQKIKFIKT